MPTTSPRRRLRRATPASSSPTRSSLSPLPTGNFLELLSLFADDGVVGVARRPKQGFDLIIRNPLDEASLADPCVATALSYFTHGPLEVFQRLIFARHHIDGVFDRDRADPL